MRMRARQDPAAREGSGGRGSVDSEPRSCSPLWTLPTPTPWVSLDQKVPLL